MYPSLMINLKKLIDNAQHLNKVLSLNNISSRFLVTKVLAGNLKIIEQLSKCGFTHLADSRIENLMKFQNIDLPKVLLRPPMISDVKRVIKYADISLNSELVTIFELNNEALKQNKIHDIILMFDLGDLREGIFYQDNYLESLEIILKLVGIRLIGIGTNLTCYGGVIPSNSILMKLVDIKEKIESTFNYKLEIISGGNSSSIPLLLSNQIPKEINNLRIGEAVMLGRETAYGKIIDNMYDDVFTLCAEIIEIKEKPSYPIGEIGMNSFGEIPTIIDRGPMRRGILAIGKQDVQFCNLNPIDDNLEILGGSSDHLIIDFSKTNYQIGDIINFKINYPGLLQLMTSNYVNKIYKQ